MDKTIKLWEKQAKKYYKSKEQFKSEFMIIQNKKTTPNNLKKGISTMENL